MLKVVSVLAGLAAILLAGMVFASVTNTCSPRGRPCRAEVESLRDSVGEDAYAKLPMQTYWLDRTARAETPFMGCAWAPELEGFVQRGVRRARELKLEPRDLPPDELWSLIDACYAHPCPLEGEPEIPPPHKKFRKASASEPAICTD